MPNCLSFDEDTIGLLLLIIVQKPVTKNVYGKAKNSQISYDEVRNLRKNPRNNAAPFSQ